MAELLPENFSSNRTSAKPADISSSAITRSPSISGQTFSSLIT
ncbi:uncharacterized protein METZ01_LOCUS97023, partial [marine metagenome]